jgi:hypothetical protein
VCPAPSQSQVVNPSAAFRVERRSPVLEHLENITNIEQQSVRVSSQKQSILPIALEPYRLHPLEPKTSWRQKHALVARNPRNVSNRPHRIRLLHLLAGLILVGLAVLSRSPIASALHVTTPAMLTPLAVILGLVICLSGNARMG